MPPGEHQRLSASARRVHGEVTFSVGVAGDVTLPVVIHRMLPADADIALAQLVVSRRGGGIEMSLSVTALIPDPIPTVAAVRTVAVHEGWRIRPDGSIRVGTWAADGPLTLPDHVVVRTRTTPKAWMLRRNPHPVHGRRVQHTDHAIMIPTTADAATGEIVLPASWVERSGNPVAIQSHRDLLMEPVRDKVASWLDDHPQPPPVETWPDLTGGLVRQWRSPKRFAALARHWRASPPPGGDDINAILQEWARRDRHLYQYQEGERDQLIRRRDDAWRMAAAAITDQCARIKLADVTLVRSRPGLTETDPALPGPAAARARARAQYAAPGELRAAITNAAQTRGVEIVTVTAAHLSRTCPTCGTVGDPGPQYAAAAVVACTCGHEYDQDLAAARLMLTRERLDRAKAGRKRSRA